MKFKHRPDRYYQYESYYSTAPYAFHEIYTWFYETYGHPGQNHPGEGKWDTHGGWFKLKGEEELAFFMLRWS